jgi:RimJ/RimL family protein N-acetyltransferase
MQNRSSIQNLILRDVVEDDLPFFFDFQLDQVANHMAAFIARDPTDRKAFTAHWGKILADPTTINQTIVCDGQVVGSVSSYELSGKPEVTYWIDRAYWGKGIARRRSRRSWQTSIPRGPFMPASPRTIWAHVGSWKSVDSESLTR